MCTLILSEINKKLKKPEAWTHAQPLTEAQLKKMREEFWDTAPYYGGEKGAYFIFLALRSYIRCSSMLVSRIDDYCFMNFFSKDNQCFIK